MDYSSFIDRISSLTNQRERYYIVDATLPVSSYMGHDSDGNAKLLFEDIGEIFNPTTLPSTEQIEIKSFASTDDKACLSFTLKETSNRDIYYTLCFDLIEATRKSNRKEAVKCLLQRFSKWHDLFMNLRRERLSIKQQQGLIAELLTLESFSKRLSFSQALRGWEGPLMKDKDFQFKDWWAEVKSCPKNGHSIEISSIGQLDSIQSGELIVYHIDHVNEGDARFSSLREIVERVTRLATTLNDAQLFTHKLSLVGYAPTDEDYAVTDTSGKVHPRSSCN